MADDVGVFNGKLVGQFVNIIGQRFRIIVGSRSF